MLYHVVSCDNIRTHFDKFEEIFKKYDLRYHHNQQNNGQIYNN